MRAVSAHKLRHTFATLYLYGNGHGRRGDVKKLAGLLGHSSVTVTYDVYAHILKEIDAEDQEIRPITGEEPKSELPTGPVGKKYKVHGYTAEELDQGLAALEAAMTAAAEQ